jgi:hypothetical protein
MVARTSSMDRGYLPNRKFVAVSCNDSFHGDRRNKLRFGHYISEHECNTHNNLCWLVYMRTYLVETTTFVKTHANNDKKSFKLNKKVTHVDDMMTQPYKISYPNSISFLRHGLKFVISISSLYILPTSRKDCHFDFILSQTILCSIKFI